MSANLEMEKYVFWVSWLLLGAKFCSEFQKELKNVKKLYFVTKIVLTYCEKKIVLVIKKNF